MLGAAGLPPSALRMYFEIPTGTTSLRAFELCALGLGLGAIGVVAFLRVFFPFRTPCDLCRAKTRLNDARQSAWPLPQSSRVRRLRTDLRLRSCCLLCATVHRRDLGNSPARALTISFALFLAAFAMFLPMPIQMQHTRRMDTVEKWLRTLPGKCFP